MLNSLLEARDGLTSSFTKTDSQWAWIRSCNFVNYLKPAFVKLRVAHVPQVPHEITTHAEHHIPERPILPPPAELLKPTPDELLVVEIRLMYLLGHLVEHLGGARPVLVRAGVTHGLLAQAAAARQRRPRPRAGELPQGEGEEDDHEEDAVGVPEVQPGRHRRRRLAAHARDGGVRARPEAPQRAEEEHAERDPAAEQRRRPDPEGADACFPGLVHYRQVELAVSMSSASRKPEPAGTGFYLKPLSSPEPLKKIGVPSSSHSPDQEYPRDQTADDPQFAQVGGGIQLWLQKLGKGIEETSQVIVDAPQLLKSEQKRIGIEQRGMADQEIARERKMTQNAYEGCKGGDGISKPSEMEISGRKKKRRRRSSK